MSDDLFDENIPIYLQIIDLIKKELISGALEPGGRLLSVRDLSKKLEVNPNTVQRAYTEMEREGVVYTKRGQGSFILDDPETISKLREEIAGNRVAAFVKEMGEFGFSHSELLERISNYLDG
jgi:DNA-binding transcriptional regulator YhcF (GntR family)